MLVLSVVFELMLGTVSIPPTARQVVSMSPISVSSVTHCITHHCSCHPAPPRHPMLTGSLPLSCIFCGQGLLALVL